MRLLQYQGFQDRERMLRLVWDNPTNHVHVIDLPYRFCSWAFEDSANVGLWEDARGKLVGWAVMQTPFWMIDLAMPGDSADESIAAALEWADERAISMLGKSHGLPSWFASVTESDIRTRNALEAAGFTSQEIGEESWSQVVMVLDANVNLPPIPVRSGYHLRELRGEYEVPAYVALHRSVFGTNNMTELWRRRILRHPAYRPELDLVIEDPDGGLAAFCIGWISKLPVSENAGGQRYYGQIEPIGVSEHGRRHGLAWSIIAEVIHRMRDIGADKIYVHTDNYRDRAFAFYQAVGFQIGERILIYRKDYE